MVEPQLLPLLPQLFIQETQAAATALFKHGHLCKNGKMRADLQKTLICDYSKKKIWQAWTTQDTTALISWNVWKWILDEWKSLSKG